MMDKEIFTTVLWGNKSEAFICIKPFNCTFTHITLTFGEKIMLVLLSPLQNQNLVEHQMPQLSANDDLALGLSKQARREFTMTSGTIVEDFNSLLGVSCRLRRDSMSIKERHVVFFPAGLCCCQTDTVWLVR